MPYLKFTFVKTIYLFSFCFLIFTSIFAQNIPKKQSDTFWNNVRFGGGIGLNVGNGFFTATLAPSAIYQFNNQFALGVGLNGSYSSSRNDFTSTILGANTIALYNIFKIQLSTEFEVLNVNRRFDDAQFLDDNFWFPALYLGIGYSYDFITFGVRYDVLFDEDRSIFQDPWAPFVRVYF